MDTTKVYFTQRNVARNGIRTKNQIFRTRIFILVHIHTFHLISVNILVNRCKQNVGSCTQLYPQELTYLIKEPYYAPNFEKLGAYCFWVVCPCVRPSVTLFDACYMS